MAGNLVPQSALMDMLQEAQNEMQLARASSLAEKHDGPWRAPSHALAQAWALREFLKAGKGQLVINCERTEIKDNMVVVCTPENTVGMPCWNCTIAILIGKKRWLMNS